MNVSYIYALLDPRNNAIRYIGKTINLRTRLARHCRASKRISHKHCWIRSLQKLGINPIMKPIEEVISDDESVWQERERFWIAKFKSEGVNLTNQDSGGCGGKRLSQEHRARLSELRKGMKHSPETCAKISAVKRNPTQETRERLSIANKGRKLSLEHREKISKAMIGHIKTEEHRKNLSKALTGNHNCVKYIKTDEHRKNLSIAMIGKNRKKTNDLNQGLLL